VRSNIGKKATRISILVTAGPTREKIDPVRFLSNYSTGTFGYEIAKEALSRGYSATLISGPTSLDAPRGARVVHVESAIQMRQALKREFPKADCLIMAAAVSDWRVRVPARGKIKRRGGRKILELVENPDILYELGRKKDGKVLVGFALETKDLIKNAYNKMREKNLDIVIANKVGSKRAAFGDDKTSILIIDKLGNRTAIFNKSKRELAKIILDKVSNFKI